jgi:hypothetical protein
MCEYNYTPKWWGKWCRRNYYRKLRKRFIIRMVEELKWKQFLKFDNMVSAGYW